MSYEKCGHCRYLEKDVGKYRCGKTGLKEFFNRHISWVDFNGCCDKFKPNKLQSNNYKTIIERTNNANPIV